MHRAYFVALLAFAVACSSTSSNGNGNGDADTQGGDTDVVATDGVTPPIDGKGGEAEALDPSAFWECADDKPCADDKLCNCNHKCVDRGLLYCNKGSKTQLCGKQEDCPDLWDACVPCTGDLNCGSDNYCDPCAHQCYPRRSLCQPCTPAVCDPATGVCAESGTQCGDYAACIEFMDGNAYCGEGCNATTGYGCPPQFVCHAIPGIAQGQCLPETGVCGSLSNCESDADCPYGEICNDMLKVCAPGCIDDGTCPSGLICSGFHCTDPCDAVNNPCDPGFECTEEGRCQKPGYCIDWRDCVEPATYCDLNDHLCKPGCLEDIDCKTAKQICEDKACVTKPCKAAWSCSFGQMCQNDAGAANLGECYEPEGPYCDTCNGDDVKSCGETNMCVNFQDEDGNDKGAFCLVACDQTDPDNVCPQGWQCQEVEDQDGNKQKECVRTCYKPPVTDY